VKLLQNPRTSPLQRIAFAMWHATVTCFAIGILAGPSYSGTKSALLQWQDASTKGVQDSQLSVPGVSRALAIINTCMYDAWAAYDEKAVGTQLGGALRRPASENTPENKQHAISYAAYRALSDVLPADIESVYKPLMRQLGYDPTDNSTDIETPTGIGNVACAAVLEFRHHDKSNQLGDFVPHENQGIAHGPYSDWTSFHPANRPLPVPVKGPIPAPGSVLDPNHWQPLSYVDSHGNTVMQMFAAHWCFIMPFALTASAWVRSESPTECPYAGQFRALLAPGPASFGDPEYIAQAQELIDLSANLTEHQKAVAEFWTASAVNDDPITRWLEFAQVISERNHFSLDDEIKLYFAVSNALMDAQIAACDVKRTYNSVRPITAITFLYNRKEIHAWGGPGKGSVAMDGSQWIPYQPAHSPLRPLPILFRKRVPLAPPLLASSLFSQVRTTSIIRLRSRKRARESSPVSLLKNPSFFTGTRFRKPPTRPEWPAATPVSTSAAPILLGERLGALSAEWFRRGRRITLMGSPNQSTARRLWPRGALEPLRVNTERSGHGGDAIWT